MIKGFVTVLLFATLTAGSAPAWALPTPDAGPTALARGGHGPAPVGTAATVSRQERIDINRATVAQLQVVPGIGPALAARIVAWRDEHGPFERIEDLLNVRGIGVKTLEKLRPHLVVGEPGAARTG